MTKYAIRDIHGSIRYENELNNINNGEIVYVNKDNYSYYSNQIWVKTHDMFPLRSNSSRLQFKCFSKHSHLSILVGVSFEILKTLFLRSNLMRELNMLKF